MMICIFLVAVIGLVLADQHAEPEYLNKLRAEKKDQEFADLLGLDVKLVRSTVGLSKRNPMMNKDLLFGDVILNKEQEEEARQGRLFNKFPQYKWPNNQIPYVIAEDDYEADEITRIEAAIFDWNRQIQNVKLVKRRLIRPQNDYVYVFAGSGCYSPIGKQGGLQALSLDYDCIEDNISRGTTQHEFMHAAGFTHEHSRPDREEYIKVLEDNIPDQYKDQFIKVSSDEYGTQGKYDYYSLIHYAKIAPGTVDKPAFEVLQSGIDEDKIGKGDTFTKVDIEKLNKLYS